MLVSLKLANEFLGEIRSENKIAAAFGFAFGQVVLCESFFNYCF